MNEQVKEMLEFKKEEELTWEEVIEYYFGLSEISLKNISFVQVEMTPERWVDSFKDAELSDEQIAEVLIKLDSNEYEGEYYEDDNPRRDSGTIYIDKLEIQLF